MKILLYSPVSLSYGGGVELYFEHLATSLDKQFGDEVQIICGDIAKRGPTAGYREVHYYKIGRFLIPSLHALSVLYTNMRWADVVYFSFGYFGQDVLMLLLKYISKTPILAAIHAPLYHSDRFHNLAISLVGPVTLPLFDGVHVLSREYAQLLRSWGVRNITHVPCGIDLKLFPYSKKKRSKKFTILFVGRLEYQKGVDFLLEIIPRLPEVEFLIAGSGSLRKHIEQTASCHKHVNYLGLVEYGKLPTVYKQADVTVFPSRKETSPAVLFEAMACGIPVLAHALPANREILGNNGYYVGKNARAWVQKIQLLTAARQKNPRGWEHRRDAVRSRAQRFDFDSLTRKLRRTMIHLRRDTS